jgi:hypothetical protein
MRVISLTAYYGRVLALVAIGNRVIPMYRSTGKAGVKGEWFPFAGVLITSGEGKDSMLVDFTEYSSNDYGWIVKMATCLSFIEGTIKLAIRWTKNDDHRNVNSRLTVDGDFPVDLFNVSKYLSDTLGSEINARYFVKVNEVGVNTWIREVTKDYFETLK